MNLTKYPFNVKSFYEQPSSCKKHPFAILPWGKNAWVTEYLINVWYVYIKGILPHRSVKTYLRPVTSHSFPNFQPLENIHMGTQFLHRYVSLKLSIIKYSIFETHTGF